MKKPENDLNNPFDDQKITDKRMDVFVGGVITKMTAANTAGIYTDVIADLTADYTPFHLNISNLNTDFLIGKGKTELRKNVIADFKVFVSNSKGAVKAKYFIAHHDLYIGFYPYEMDDYSKINKTTAQGLIDRYAAVVHTNVADFTPQFDTDAATFKTRYSTAVDTQDIAKGQISTDRTGRGTGREALNISLFSAYNFVKSKCKADYDFMHGIFPIETLERHSPQDIKHYSGTETALATINVVEAIYDDTYWVLFHNNGTTDQRIGLELTAGTPAGTVQGKVVKAGRNKSFRITSLGTAGNQFLNVTNLNLTEGGSWKADIYTED